jgi:GT2 family glycosyltransferase
VLAVVVTHDGRAWLRDCLVSLAAQRYGAIDVLVVDDATPRSKRLSAVKRIAKRHLRRRRWGYLRTPRPLGYGGAINWAMSRVRTDADFLLFVHDDVELTLDSVKRMVERAADDEATAVVGPKIVAWDDPSVLEEVGMAVDRFGYPYKGLEEGEIDLGQHDTSGEVFYVTSTCMLMRHELFRSLNGWDSRLGAYAEDLDLCWRARLTGRAIRLEPGAVARHAMAMATGQRRTRFKQARYFIRRNRLRTVLKNASALRLLALVPQFLLLTLAEMLGFLALRQPREVGNLARALLWNLARLPQTLAERGRVQRMRKVSDRALQRFTVKEATRMRAYVAHQSGRLEEAWGRRAEVVAARTSRARSMTRRIGPPQVAVAGLLLLALIVGFRHFLWSPFVSVGELLPLPDRTTSMWQAWAAPWRSVGLGEPGPAPPAFFILGLFQVAALGAAGVAQKLLIAVLGLAAFLGAYRLVSEIVGRPGRLVAGLVYALGAVGYAGVRSGALGALVFGAAAPFALHSMLRLSGWARPPRWSAGKEIARLGIYAAVSAAFVPGSLLLYAMAALVLSLTRSLLGRRRSELRALVGSAAGLVVGWALLLPWSATWLAPGGALERLTATETTGEFAWTFREHGMASVLLGQMPEGPALFGLGLPLLGLIAVAVAEGQRRRAALALWTVVIATGALATAFATGWLPPLVATPTELGVMAALSYAGLAGLAVGAFRLDLPRRGLGLLHAATVGGLAVATFLLGAGLLPTLWHGDWQPGGGYEGQAPEVVQEVRSFLDAEMLRDPTFRVLWVGDGWGPPVPSAAVSGGRTAVTDGRGGVLTNLFERKLGSGYDELESVIGSVESGATDRAGGLLGAFNIDYVVLERSGAEEEWLGQGNLAVVSEEPTYLILENHSTLERAGLYSRVPSYVAALEEADPSVIAGAPEPTASRIERRSASSYWDPDAGGPGAVFLAETRNSGWHAELGGRSLERTEAGWGNGFQVPAAAAGSLELTYQRSVGDVAWLVVVVLLWIFIAGAAFPGRSRGRVAARRPTR